MTMGHALAVGYDQMSLGSTGSRIRSRTYDGSAASKSHASHGIYTTPTCVSLKRIQVHTAMFTQGPRSAAQDSNNQTSRSAARRSVSGMKSLLPLKLLSPHVEETEVWPLSAPSHRTTFGMRLSSRFEERRSSMNEPAQYQRRQPPTTRPNRYRDTPIYSERGTPLPSPAYFNDDEMSSYCSRSSSICDKDRMSNLECDDEMKTRREHELGELQETIESICDDTFLDATSPSSALSFQCSGEDMFPDEALWLRSPLNISNWPRPNALSQPEMELVSAEHSVENWLCDTSSYFDEDGDSLACATIVSQARANVVDVSLSPSSGLAINIPPRSSSLDRPITFSFPLSNNRESQISYADSPPITPAEGEESNTPSKTPSLSKKFQPSMPRRRLDLSIPSPPLSPKVNSLVTPNRPPRAAINTLDGRSQDGSSWPLPNDVPIETSDDILRSLEEWTTNFPSTMLLAENPAIAQIRLRLSQPFCSGLPHVQPLLAPFSPNSSPSRIQSQYRRKTSDPSRPAQPTFIKMDTYPSVTPYRPSHSSEDKSAPQDLQPIQNIFPTSTRTMQSALYAHVLAYMYIISPSTLPPRSPTPTTSPRQKRRGTPYWNPTSPRTSHKAAKASNSVGDNDRTSFSPYGMEEESDRLMKVKTIQEDLRKCIFCIVSVMDENFSMENMVGAESADIERGPGMILLRSLIEVVRGSERRAAGFF